MITKTEFGFYQTYDGNAVEEILFFHSGECKVSFADGTSRSFSVPISTAYTSQYGVPLSDDGKLMFVSDWDRGLTAYTTDTGTAVWNYKGKRISNVFVYGSKIAALKRNEKLIFLQCSDGTFLKEIRSTTIETAFQLTASQILVCHIGGRLTVLNLQTLDVEAVFPKGAENPASCLSLIITGAELSEGEIVITGFERGANRRYNKNEPIAPFQRTIQWDNL